MRWLIGLSLFFMVFVVGYSLALVDVSDELVKWECQGEFVLKGVQ